MQEKGMLWKVWLMVVPMALAVSTFAWAQPDAQLAPVVVPILEHEGRLIMAARIEIGRYGGRGPDRRELERMFAGMDEAARWRWPEFVLLEHFRLFQLGDAEASYALWDEESREEVFPGGIEGLRAQYQQRLSRDAAESIQNFRVIAQSRFGPYARLDIELTRVFPNGETSILPTEFHFVVDRASGRWFQTSAVSRISLFGTVADIALRGQPPAIARALDEGAVAEWRWLASAGERRPEEPSAGGRRLPMVTRLRFVYHAGRGREALGQVAGEHPIVMYYDFSLAPSVVAIESDPLPLNEAQRLVRTMQAAYAARDEAAVLALWAPEERDAQRRVIEEAKRSGAWSQPETVFGPWGRKRTLLGTIPTDEGTVILYDAGGARQPNPLALYVVRGTEGQPLLSSKLGVLEKDRLFRRRDFVEALIAAASQ